MIKWAVKEGWGYSVEIRDCNDTLIEHCDIGDCWTDNKIFNTRNMSKSDLQDMALFVCSLMKDQYGVQSAPIEDLSILPWKASDENRR
jgi:hypothetical protein